MFASENKGQEARGRDHGTRAILPGYDVPTAAHSAAYFANKAGGSIDFLKLAKLMYMAERAYMEKYDEPLFYDHFVSLKNGPVPSITLDLMNGRVVHEDWSKLMGNRDKENGAIEYAGNGPLDHLSIAEEEILAEVWNRFSDFDGKQLANWTHENCPEWQEPDGGSTPIPHELVFKHLGKECASELAEDVERFRQAQAGLNASV